jgi:hypothetical protein
MFRPTIEVTITTPIKLFPRNGKWVASAGPSLCEGVFEVGDTAAEAIAKLERCLVQVSPACAVCTGTPISRDLP